MNTVIIPPPPHTSHNALQWSIFWHLGMKSEDWSGSRQCCPSPGVAGSLLIIPSKGENWVSCPSPALPNLSQGIHYPHLCPRTPQAHDGVDAAGRQEARCGVRLQAVDDRVVSPKHLHNVGGALLPDEERAVIWPGHDILTIAESDKQGQTQALRWTGKNM